MIMTIDEAITHCEDISRSCDSSCSREHHKLAEWLKELKSLKSNKGKWIEVEVLPEVYDIEGVKTWGSKMQCDQCGFMFVAVEGHIGQYNYCPYCGADMRGEEK